MHYARPSRLSHWRYIDLSDIAFFNWEQTLMKIFFLRLIAFVNVSCSTFDSIASRPGFYTS
jgi:hypothetical protein